VALIHVQFLRAAQTTWLARRLLLLLKGKARGGLNGWASIRAAGLMETSPAADLFMRAWGEHLTGRGVGQGSVTGQTARHDSEHETSAEDEHRLTR